MPGQLAGLIRAKYPGAYDDMDDATLEKSVLAKYPEYQDLATPEAAPSATAADMLMRRRVTSDAPEQPSTMGKLNDALTPLAHPQSARDVAGLLIPSSGGEVIARTLAPVAGAIGKYGGAAVDLATSILPTRARAAVGVLRELNPTTWNSPLTVAGREARAHAGAGRQIVQGAEQFSMPRVERTVDRAPQAAQVLGDAPPEVPSQATWTQGQAPPPPPTPSPGVATAAPVPAAPQGLSQAERTALARQGYPPDLIAKIEASAAQPMIQGRLRMGPVPAASASPPPIQVDQASLPQSWRDLPHPLDPQRVDVGAEVTGRANGMTKQEVRDVATPILDAKPGEASPILPEASLGRIVDTLKAMPPGSAEREAYVARATSGKAQWQIENIRRTLEHLGLLVPVAAAAPSVRDEVMKRLTAPQTERSAGTVPGPRP